MERLSEDDEHIGRKNYQRFQYKFFGACIPAVKNTRAPESFFQDQKAIHIKLAESYVVATESIQAQNVSFDQFFVQMAGMVSACGTCLFERLLVKYSTRDAIPYVFSYFKAGTLVEMCKLGPVSNTFMWLQFVPGTQQAGQWPHSFTYLWILQCCTWS